jgi:hypothetical protein
MKNYINARIQAHNNLKIGGVFKHDFRIVQSRNQKNNNRNVCFDLRTNEYFGVRCLSKIEQSELSKDELLNYKNDRKKLLKFYNNQLENYKNDRSEHNELYKKRRKGEKIPSSTGTYAEGIFTFSEKIESDFNNNKLDLGKFFLSGVEAAKETCDYLGAELVSVVVHLDEKCPHVHYLFKNFDEEGRSLTYLDAMKKKGLKLEYLQDIATKHFKEDFGIERGISKEVKGKTRHQDTSDYYDKLLKAKNLELKEQDEKIKLQKEESKKLDDDNELKKEILNQFDEKIETTKHLRKSITESENLSNNQKKGFHNDVSEYQQKMRQARKILTSKDENKRILFNNFIKVIKSKEENKLPKFLVFEALKFFDEINDSIEDNELDEIVKNYDKVFDEVSSLKMTIRGMNEDIKELREVINNKNTTIGHINFQLEHIDSANEVKTQEATRTLRNELNDVKSTSKDKLEAKDETIEKQIKQIIKRKQIIKKYSENRKDSKIDLNSFKYENERLIEFLTKKGLLKEFRSVEDSASNRLDVIIDNDFSLSSIVIDNNKKTKK